MPAIVRAMTAISTTTTTGATYLRKEGTKSTGGEKFRPRMSTEEETHTHTHVYIYSIQNYWFSLKHILAYFLALELEEEGGGLGEGGCTIDGCPESTPKPALRDD